MARRSDTDVINADTQVYLADSMGEMMTWYALANVAFVGGSLVDVGGHNPVEPASVATPVIMGTYTQSCQNVVDTLSEVGALYQPNNDWYCPITADNTNTKHQQSTEQHNATPHKKSSRKRSTDDHARLYQQLYNWLSDLPLSIQAGQAGAQMTMQQQAVLVRQFTMIEDAIEPRLTPKLSQEQHLSQEKHLSQEQL